jgi:hypothetical protein
MSLGRLHLIRWRRQYEGNYGSSEMQSTRVATLLIGYSIREIRDRKHRIEANFHRGAYVALRRFVRAITVPVSAGQSGYLLRQMPSLSSKSHPHMTIPPHVLSYSRGDSADPLSQISTPLFSLYRGEEYMKHVSRPELIYVRACNAAGKQQYAAIILPVQCHVEVHTIYTTDLFCDENDAC